jgi:2,3-bisphosphoglycerate-independent phosphoglycerate mutase
MGNSEVGHITIGAGRIFYQSLPRINLSIESGEFFANQALLKAIEHSKASGGYVHLMGLVSAGGVHASQEHLYALLELCKKQKFDRVLIHAFLDGRDTIFNSAQMFLQELQAKMTEIGVGAIVSLAGRYYAMDRDNRWDRTQLAYDAITQAKGPTASSVDEAVQASYASKVYDEQFVPTVILQNGQKPRGVQEGDAVVFFNFRPDRARQLTKAFCLPVFSKFERVYIKNVYMVTMTEYEKELPVEVAFPPQLVDKCLMRP